MTKVEISASLLPKLLLTETFVLVNFTKVRDIIEILHLISSHLFGHSQLINASLKMGDSYCLNSLLLLDSLYILIHS